MKTICPKCGEVLEVEEEGAEDNWLPCLDLEDVTAKIPAGCRKLASGEVLYRDAGGDEYTAEAYKEKWGIDPEPVWAVIKAYQKDVGMAEPVKLGGGKTRPPKVKF